MELEQLDLHMQKNKVGLPTSRYIQKITQNDIKDLNIKAETIKHLEKNIGENLFDLELDKDS